PRRGSAREELVHGRGRRREGPARTPDRAAKRRRGLRRLPSHPLVNEAGQDEPVPRTQARDMFAADVPLGAPLTHHPPAILSGKMCRVCSVNVTIPPPPTRTPRSRDRPSNVRGTLNEG